LKGIENKDFRIADKSEIITFRVVFYRHSMQLTFNWYLLVILLGIFQAFLLSTLIIVKGFRNDNRFIFLGLFLLSLGLILSEVFLNYSGYITRII